MPNYVVRHGVMRLLAECSSPKASEYNRGDQVIARTDRGLEIAEVLTRADKRNTRSLEGGRRGEILRYLTEDDANELVRIRDREVEEYDICSQFVSRIGLQMNLIDVEHLFGGERVIVYYLADGRVDFRELVKLLAGEFQTRIEMRQIGVRDEAKLLADYGDCGKPVCCNTHLTQMPPVSMKMAKLQKATLDPTKISGRCGRLKCCLRYEYDDYDQVQRQLPSIGASVETADGAGRVVAHEILSEQVVVELADRVRRSYAVGEISPSPRGRPAPNQPSSRDDAARSDEQSES